MWIVVVGVMLLPEKAGGTGAVHPEFGSMRYGGSGVDRHAQVLWLGWSFGALILLMVAAPIALGSRKNGTLRGLGPWLVASAALLMGVWSWLDVACSGYMRESTHALYLGFPAPTVIMLFGLVPCSIVFNLLFVTGFRRRVLPDRDLAEFERLLEERRVRLLRDRGEAAHSHDEAADVEAP